MLNLANKLEFSQHCLQQDWHPNPEGFFSERRAAQLLNVAESQVKDWVTRGVLKDLSVASIKAAYLDPPRRGIVTVATNPHTGELVRFVSHGALILE